jgi:hypothetical protein
MARQVRQRPWWQVLGIAVVVVLAIVGLATVAAFVLFLVALGNMGSNK